MFPILFRTEFGFVYTFTAVWLLGLALSGAIIWWQDKKFDLWDHLLIAVTGGLLFGRMQFVVQNSEWFAENPAERWNLFQGGHGYTGVVLGGLIALWLWTQLKGTAIRPILIMLAPSVALLHLVGWLACWFDGCGYGAPTFIGWYSAELPNNFGLMLVRYQTQLAGALLAGLFGAGLLWRRWQQTGKWLQFKPSDFWLSLSAMGAGRGLVYLWQGDVTPMWAGLRIDMLMAFLIAIVSLILFGLERIKDKG